MANAIIVCTLVVIAIFSVKSYIKKLRSGCCGGGNDEAVKPTDTNKEHYPYNAVIKVTGMTCGGCIIRTGYGFESIIWRK